MILIFKYPLTEITGNAKILSQYRENSLLQKGNNVPLDDTALTEEDVKILNKYLKTGCAEIANIVSGYSDNLVDEDENELLPFEFNVADPDEEVNENVFIFRMAMPETFNKSVIQPMDEAIKDALENYLLYRTSKHKMNEVNSYNEDYESSLGLIRSYINRRTASTTRNHNLLL